MAGDTVAVGSGVVMPTAEVLAISMSTGETAVSGWINAELCPAITTSHVGDAGGKQQRPPHHSHINDLVSEHMEHDGNHLLR